MIFIFVFTSLQLGAETIRVVTINVWSGLTYKGAIKNGEYEDAKARDFRYELLVKELKDLDADVIGVNEANMLPGYARKLAEDLGYSFIYQVRLGGLRIGPVGFPLNLREGDVVLAKNELELELAGTIRLSGGIAGNVVSMQSGHASQVLVAKVKIGGRPVYVCLSHWQKSEFAYRDNLVQMVDRYFLEDLEADRLLQRMRSAIEGKKRRLAEAEETVEFINGLVGEEPVILVGSFEALPNSEEIAHIIEAGFTDTFRAVGRGTGYTWDEMENSNIIRYYLNNDKEEGITRRRDRIDYIFTRGQSIKPLRSWLAFNKETYGVHPSDHYGVVCEIEIEPLPEQ